MLARILNYTGANGTYFCPFCDIMLEHMIKGISHTPTILPKYEVKNTRVVKEYTSRTLQDLREHAISYTKRPDAQNVR